MIIQSHPVPEAFRFIPVSRTILQGYPADSLLFFDIETTGFKAAVSQLYLIGVLRLDSLSGEWILTQYMAESAYEEEALLHEFLSLLMPHTVLIHYNGDRFDLPYLQEKCRIYHLDNPLSTMISIDLYTILRKSRNLLGLSALNLKCVENALGIYRKDPFDGGELIEVYHAFLQELRIASQNSSSTAEVLSLSEKKDTLLLHNCEDICHLTSIASLCSFAELMRGNFTVSGAVLRQPAETDKCWAGDFSIENLLVIRCRLNDRLLFPIGCSFTEKHFRLTTVLPSCSCCTTSKADPGILSDPSSLSETGEGFVSEEAGEFLFEVPVYRTALKHFYPDYKNYYYLPEEDTAMHKSVAGYIDKSLRVPAKACNCYTKKEGAFLWQPEQIFEPVFKESSRDKNIYFLFHEKLTENPEILQKYAEALCAC